MKTTPEIVKEIERRIAELTKEIRTYSSMDHMWSQYAGEMDGLDSLLSWITQENNLDGVADD